MDKEKGSERGRGICIHKGVARGGVRHAYRKGEGEMDREWRCRKEGVRKTCLEEEWESKRGWGYLSVGIENDSREIDIEKEKEERTRPTIRP